MKSEEINFIEVKQKSKHFYIASINASDIYKNGRIIRNSENPDEGVQRFLEMPRVHSIAQYCEENDTTPLFLTPIIVSINSDYVNDFPNSIIDRNIGKFKLELNGKDNNVFNVIDGQHRLFGIKEYEEKFGNEDKIQVPISFVFDANVYECAEIFIDINANQKKVNTSIIYQLFGLMANNGGKKTVQSFANKVVLSLNDSEYSPFFHSIKMLGRKENNKQFISQNTIANKVVYLINRMTDFKDLYRSDDFKFVAKTIINFFNAFIEIYQDVWNSKDGLAKKAVGFSALIRFYEYLFPRSDDLTKSYFKNVFSKIKKNTDSDFMANLFRNKGSSESEAKRISDDLIKEYNEIINRKKSNSINEQ